MVLQRFDHVGGREGVYLSMVLLPQDIVKTRIQLSPLQSPLFLPLAPATD